MNWIYLAFAVLLALGATSALVPPARNTVIALPQFLFGFLVCEIPVHVLGATVAASLVAIAAQALNDWVARVALAISATSALAFIYSYLRARRAAPTLEHALRSALGESYQGEIIPERASLLRRRRPMGLLARPFRLRYPSVE